MEGKKIKLHYFNLNGRGRIPRMLLTLGKFTYEDKMYSFEDYPNVKDNFDFKFFPVLEIDGFQYSQSQAINLYLAKKIGGLLGKSDEDEQIILSSLLAMDDINAKFFPHILNMGDPKETKSALEKILAQVCCGLEAQYKRNGKGKYFLGDIFTLADICVPTIFIYFIQDYKDLCYDILNKNMPEYLKVVERVLTEEPIVSLLKQVTIPNSI